VSYILRKYLAPGPMRQQLRNLRNVLSPMDCPCPKKFLTTKGTKKHELFLELGGVLIVTFRNSIANSCLFSLTNLHPASCTWEHSNMSGQVSITTGTVALLFKPHAIPSVEATTLYKNFRVFSCGSWLKNAGCGRQPTPSFPFGFTGKQRWFLRYPLEQVPG
jgi:hypothetical protein